MIWVAYFYWIFWLFFWKKKWTFKVRTLTSIHDNCWNYFEKSTRSSEWKLRERRGGGQDKPSIFSNRRCIFQVSMHHVHVLVCATSDGNRLNLSIIWIIKVQFIQKIKKQKSRTITQNCCIWIFEFWHFPAIFVAWKVTYLETLLDRKLQVFKNSPKLTIFGFFD